MVHNMNTRPDVRADLTNPRAIVQTFLRIIVSFIAARLGVYRVRGNGLVMVNTALTKPNNCVAEA